MTNSMQDDVCCPPFEPSLWNEKTFSWKDKPFLRTTSCTLWYIPFWYGSAMRRIELMLKAANANHADALTLSLHKSPWRMDLLAATDKPVHGAAATALSGTYFAKVYEGDFKHTGAWHKEFVGRLIEREALDVPVYSWYTTCPKCAKKYGKNYVVLFGRIGEA